MRPTRLPAGTCTAAEAGAILRCSPFLLWKWAATGHIKYVDIPGFADLFDRKSVEAHAARMTAANPLPPKRGQRRVLA
jgi:hypothetical protein